MVEHARDLAGPFTMVYLCPMGGAAGRVDPTATAYPHRSSAYSFHALAGWQDSADDEANIAWVRRFHEAMATEASGGVYVNLLAEDEGARVGSAYGPNYQRLAEIKRRWDPDNLLHHNHNIAPAG
jgi:FAD/FMN-containing dehydrogenase